MSVVHRFSYPSHERVDHPPPDEMDEQKHTAHGKQSVGKRRNKLHWQRDGDAGTYYAAKLALRAGYDFSLELNPPSAGIAANERANRGAAAEERLKKGDIILLNTRPPLTNNANHLLAQIERSNSWVEDKIINVVSKVFTICSRDEVVLSGELAKLLPSGKEKRAKSKFMARPEAHYTYKAAYDSEYEEIHSVRTAGYLFYSREIWPNGPDLLCSFAMSGPMNLAWAYLVATRYEKYVLPGEDRFFMADIDPQPSGAKFPDWPDSLEFTSRWKIEPQLERWGAKLWL